MWPSKLTTIFSAFCLTLIGLMTGCTDSGEPKVSDLTLFRYVSQNRSGLQFNNTISYNEEVNPYTFRNFFNGAGVGLGDLNNDGLSDIVLAGNMVPSRIFLNKGNLSFNDITATSGIGTDVSWTTGISLADVNQDGWLDIYLCKSGPPGGKRRKNELFINNKNLTFSEAGGSYGLDFEGLATQAVFLDYDLDGDPDCYLLNNSYRPVGVFDYRKDQRNIPDPQGGNRLLRNDGQSYTDVTQKAGIYSSSIGFGLGVAVGDINDDGWPDMFVSNDFFERDYLYINRKDGTFRESLEDYMNEVSLGSMGADVADLNNDGRPEVFVTEMLPEHDDRLKTNGQFENWNRYQQAVQSGYGRQFGRNVLQLNNGNGTFSEIGRYAGVEATDWSWGALLFDMDNDGWKDIFVANGIYKDLLDQDYVTYVANPEFIRKQIRERGKVIEQLIDSIPSHRQSNYAFRNNKDLTFTNMAVAWGLDLPTHSNGSAYGDMDNDGDLDLVINNINQPAFLYESRARQLLPQHHSVSFDLRQHKDGPHALGTKVTIWTKGEQRVQELAPWRGFMSVADPKLVVGIGNHRSTDSVIIRWPGGKETRLYNTATDSLYVLHEPQVQASKFVRGIVPQPYFNESLAGALTDFVHKENDFVDFDRDRLLFNMISNEGPCLCSGDVNGDGKKDVYVGGAKDQAGQMFIQTSGGAFRAVSNKAFDTDLNSEDTDCVIADFDGDGKPDLYVASGGIEYSRSASALSDRLYLNTGNGQFRKSDQILPVSTRFESTSVITASDIDSDGDLDLFAGIRSVPFEYGIPCNGYILENDGRGHFKDISSARAPELKAIGMITDAIWADIDQDGKTDLIVTGEWMGIRVFHQESNKWIDRSKDWGTTETEGWYHALHMVDVNHDGFPDLVAGNHGLNSRFRAKPNEPIQCFINDFDQNGTLEHIVTRFDNGKPYPLVLRPDLISQIPSLKRKLLYHRQYSGKQLNDIFSPEQLNSSLVLTAREMTTGLWLNADGKKFMRGQLPAEAQYFPVYAIASMDINRDTHPDLILGGNQYQAKPETGIYAAGQGLLLVGDGTGRFAAAKSTDSGLLLKGQIRALEVIENGRLIAAQSNGPVRMFNLKK